VYTEELILLKLVIIHTAF